MKDTRIIDETITWNKVANMMTTTAAEAPYLGAVQAKGTVMFADFVKGVKDDGCSESELEIGRIMTKQGELLKSYVAQNYKVYTPYGIAGAHITKSFPAQDAPFDPTVNEAIMSIQTNAETRNSLVGVKLKEDRAAAATLKGPKINSVCTGGADFDVIDGTEPFVIAGTGLHLDKTKATDKVTLANVKTGAVTDVTDYTCDGEGFRIDAQLGTALPAGKYVLAVHVDEGTEDNPNVLSAERKVTVTGSPVPPPPSGPSIDKVRYDHDASKPGDAMSLATGEFSVFGANLKSGDVEPTVAVEARTAGGDWTEMPVEEIVEATAAEINVRLNGLPFSEDEYVRFRVTVTNALGSAVHEGDLV